VTTPNDYGPNLLPQHAKLLADSAIAPAVAAERGYVSVERKGTLQTFGFGGGGLLVPTLVIPVHNELGQVALHQHRPDNPRRGSNGRVRKYELPYRARLALDVPPRARAQLGDPTVPLWVTEGSRKADAAVSAGLCCAALIGVWGHRGTNAKGGKTALPAWESVALNGRRVYVAYDSDVMVNPNVHAALVSLGEHLQKFAAEVAYVYLPTGPGGAKVGLDDYFAAGGTVDDLLLRARPDPVKPAGEGEQQGHAGPVEDVPLEAGASLLAEVETFVRQFLVFSNDAQAVVVTLEIIHTWTFEAAETTPYLHVTSAVRLSGKTRLLEVLALLARGALQAADATPAAVYRAVAESTPTILFDEVQDLFGRGADEGQRQLRAVLNSGYRKGGNALRVVGEGTNQHTEKFPTFCPKVLAGTGSLPDMLASRSIPIRLRRKTPAESKALQRFRIREVSPEAEALRGRLAGWAQAALESLEGAAPELPEELDDRQQDMWEPLLAIADLAGGDWPERAREAAVTLHSGKVGDDELDVLLLDHIRQVFTRRKVERISTDRLLGDLVQHPEGPWSERWGHQVHEYAGEVRGDLLGPARYIAWRLEPFEVKPVKWREGKTAEGKWRHVRGYERAAFEDAWARYLPPPPPPPASEPPHPTHGVKPAGQRGNEAPKPSAAQPSDAADGSEAKTAGQRPYAADAADEMHKEGPRPQHAPRDDPHDDDPPDDGGEPWSRETGPDGRPVEPPVWVRGAERWPKVATPDDGVVVGADDDRDDAATFIGEVVENLVAEAEETAEEPPGTSGRRLFDKDVEYGTDDDGDYLLVDDEEVEA